MKLTHESVFIYPTDTVWGLGASIESLSAQRKIASIKKTTEDKPLSIMFTNVEVLFESFYFPAVITLEWLKEYFKLESTLGIELKNAQIKIPKWVTGQSDMVSVRCLEVPELQEIYSELKTPFFTTSLNLTGLPPITSFLEASEFQKTHASDSKIFGSPSHNLSGRSSTIVFLRDNEFKIIREGQRIQDIKNHLKLTGFRVS